MKITFNWLRHYVDFDGSPEDLAGRLTLLGLEVEGMQKLGGEFDGIVVGQVITRDKHPNADKLSLCRVHDGKGERQIVCGAQNFQPGDKVPLILPGASLAPKPGETEPFLIKVGKIRGVESQGMMCSGRELGLSDDHEGLMILRPDAVVGQPFAEYLGRAGSDVVFDLEITPNRPDLNSVIGIAREISAVTGRPLKVPELNVAGALVTAAAEPHQSIDRWITVRVDEAGLCPRYVARIVQGVQIGPSPDWLRTTLEKVGLRSINNVVDVTNYVMLETGQPLHAFDYHLVGASPGEGAQAPGASGAPVSPAPTLVVRCASEGEKFTTLDGQDRVLTPAMLLIADDAKAIALAGVMGGQNTEIRADTRDVLIESAYFKPSNIRRTSKALGLRSESSYRFERGADPGITDWASRRCAQLILATAGGALVSGAIDACPQPSEQRQVTLRHARVAEVLGTEIPPADQVRHLTALGLEVAGPAGATCAFRIPTFRVDLKREIDLIEEIARLHGVDKLPATPPRGAIGSHPFDAVQDQISEARRLLTSLGLDEAQGQTLIAKASVAGASAGVVPLAHPLSSDMDVLRPSLLPGLIQILHHNVSRRNNDVAIFEIGRVFASKAGGVREERRVGLALTGRRHATFWSGEEREARLDLYDLKGVLEEFLEQFGLRGVSYVRREADDGWFLESATLALGGKLALGEMGQLSPALARKFDLRDPVLLAELNLDQLLARRSPGGNFKPLPPFPSIRRDVALVVPESVTHDAVLTVVRQGKAAHLEAAELFDVFRGPTLPAGRKSVAYAFTYRHPERTLTDAEVNAAHEKLVRDLEQKLEATAR